MAEIMDQTTKKFNIINYLNEISAFFPKLIPQMLKVLSEKELNGIKENVAIGHMIPAGTGIKNYKDIKLFDDVNKDLDDQMNEILERRRIEAESESQADVSNYETEDVD